MTDTTTAPAALTIETAEKLAVAIEIISQDLHAPFEISPRIGQKAISRFTVIPILPDTQVTPKATVNETSRAIAQDVQAWATRLQYVADAIRERYPLPSIAPDPESGILF